MMNDMNWLVLWLIVAMIQSLKNWSELLTKLLTTVPGLDDYVLTQSSWRNSILEGLPIDN